MPNRFCSSAVFSSMMTVRPPSLVTIRLEAGPSKTLVVFWGIGMSTTVGDGNAGVGEAGIAVISGVIVGLTEGVRSGLEGGGRNIPGAIKRTTIAMNAIAM